MENLKIIRKSKKLSQKDLADILNVTQSTYSKYERGLVEPDFTTIKQLSKFFDVSTDYLLDMIEIPMSSNDTDFIRKIKNVNDPQKIAEEFEVLWGDRVVTGKELLEIMKTMKELDEAVHGNFFSKNNEKK